MSWRHDVQQDGPFDLHRELRSRSKGSVVRICSRRDIKSVGHYGYCAIAGLSETAKGAGTR
jgi:hypothetical protein